MYVKKPELHKRYLLSNEDAGDYDDNDSEDNSGYGSSHYDSIFIKLISLLVSFWSSGYPLCGSRIQGYHVITEETIVSNTTHTGGWQGKDSCGTHYLQATYTETQNWKIRVQRVHEPPYQVF